jgi:hypothetical protein
MYMDLKQKYWWNVMKADIARFITHCDTCQRIKAEHQKPAGLLQPLPILVWKWDEIGMDFVVGLPKTQDFEKACIKPWVPSWISAQHISRRQMDRQRG